jgi:hypothetical protein
LVARRMVDGARNALIQCVSARMKFAGGLSNASNDIANWLSQDRTFK